MSQLNIVIQNKTQFPLTFKTKLAFHFRTRGSARKSFQVIKLWYGCPVTLSQVMNVLRCVHIPRPASWLAWIPALLKDRSIVEQIRCQKSSGSISTYPGEGYISCTSSCADPRTCSDWSKIMQRMVVVPTSKAATNLSPSALSILCQALSLYEWPNASEWTGLINTTRIVRRNTIVQLHQLKLNCVTMCCMCIYVPTIYSYTYTYVSDN